jgi:hypothetical protein
MPLRPFLGEAPLGIATADYESWLATWREWQANGSQWPPPPRATGIKGTAARERDAAR